MTDFKPTAASIFLSSVVRSQNSTGERPKNNIVSSALMTLVIDESGFMLKEYPLGEIPHDSLMGYPIRVVKSDFIFAVSIDSVL